MQIAVVIEGQMNLSYEQQLAAARRAEAVGISGFFRTDHYQSFPGSDDQATTDAWSVLAGIARETKSIPLGTLVSPVTFRAPGEFAKVVATGRAAEAAGLGLNAGHDLTRGNLPALVKALPNLQEVSIGHAVIADAMMFGLGETVRKFRMAIGDL